MADIKDRIKAISEYFEQMQVQQVNDKTLIYVIVHFPQNWFIDEDIEKNYDIRVKEGNNSGEYYFVAEMDTGFDKIFDAIEYNIDKVKRAIERANLLKIKINELKTLFEDETITLESLRTLDFSYKGKKRTKSATFLSKATEKEEDKTEEEEETLCQTD